MFFIKKNSYRHNLDAAKQSLTSTKTQMTKNREILEKMFTQTRKHNDNTNNSKAIRRRQRTRPTPLTRTLQQNLLAETTTTRRKGQQPKKGGKASTQTNNHDGKASVRSNLNQSDDCGKASASPERRQRICQRREIDDQVRPDDADGMMRRQAHKYKLSEESR